MNEYQYRYSNNRVIFLPSTLVLIPAICFLLASTLYAVRYVHHSQTNTFDQAIEKPARALSIHKV